MSVELATPDNQIEIDEQIRSSIIAELLELGLEYCPEGISSRFSILESNSQFNRDSRMIREGFESVLSAIEKKRPEIFSLTEKHRKEGKLASFLHDIGKSGPSDADSSHQLAVVKLFPKQTIKNPDVQTVSEIVKTFHPNEYEDMILKLSEVGIVGDMTMRDFFNMHSLWTKDILEKYPEVFSERVRIIASSHHIIDRGINPYNLNIDEVPNESKVIGTLEYYVDVLEEKILIAMDQYQSRIARDNRAHEKVMEQIKSFFSKYKGDSIMDLILETVDELGSQNLLFPKTGEKYLTNKS